MNLNFQDNPHSFIQNLAHENSEDIQDWQKSKINHYAAQPLKHEPIFIIGAPRTGSTILYQAITNLYDVLYIDNLVCKHNKNFFFGFWLSNKIYGTNPHNNYRSEHGATSKYGLHAPSECGQFWYKWFPKDHHYLEADEIPEEQLEEIRKEITAVINYFDKPLIFKNLNAGQRIKIITKIFPNAYFINVKRDLFFNVQSILLAKRKLGIPDSRYWSIMPKNIKELKAINNPYEQIVKQVNSLRKGIDTDKILASKERFFEINYKNINLNLVHDVCKSIKLKRKDEFKSPVFKPKEIYKLSEIETHKIKKEIGDSE